MAAVQEFTATAWRAQEGGELGFELARRGAGGEPARADDRSDLVDFRFVRIRQGERPG